MTQVRNRSRETGMTLTEVMVATAVMLIIIVGILLLYDRGNRVFKNASEAADMQQNLRIAYDRMLADVRMAGFDYKRGGPMLPGQTAAPWTVTRAYSAGTIVSPSTPNGQTYRALNSGTSGTSEPTWPLTAGDTYVETGATPAITWQENGGAVYEPPDEQVEFAGATAITIRGNLDYSANESGDVDHGREQGLESANFPVVTTENDEIVTYALVSGRAPSGTAPNNQSITMFVDMNTSGAQTRAAHPGGRAEVLRTISGLDLTNANPPYVLYRFTFDTTGAVQRVPLAENIRSLNFFYYADPSGQVPLRDAAAALAPNVGGGGQYSPTVVGSWNAPERLVRQRIRGIRVRLVGMSSQPDPKYRNDSIEVGMYGSTSTAGVPAFVTDTVAPTYRRVVADTLVAPRNLGLTGMPQTFLQPPPVPTITSACAGYCGIVVVNWNPNSNNPNASYAVLWDTSATGSFSNALDAGPSNTFAVDLTQEDKSLNYYFRIRAFNTGGSNLSPIVGPVAAANATTFNAATGLTASGAGGIPGIPGKVRLNWAAPITNASGAPSCTSGTPTVSNYLREIQGFRIYRNTTPNVLMIDGNKLVDETTSGAAAPTSDGYGNYTWDDTTAACGTNYYYRVRTVEWCAAQDSYNTTNDFRDALSAPIPATGTDGVEGRAGSSGTPAIPVNLESSPPAPAAPPIGMLNSVCYSDPLINKCDVRIRWSKVTQDTSGNPMNIDEYYIERTQFNGDGTPTLAPPEFITMTGAQAIPGSSITYVDSTPDEHDPGTMLDYIYKYRVKALQNDPCPDGAYSALVEYPPPCTFTGSIIVQTGALRGDGETPATAWVMNTGDGIRVNPPAGTTFVLTTMEIVESGGTVIDTQTSISSPSDFSWVNLTPGEVYTLTFTMTNTAVPPCTEQIVRYVQQEPLPACSLTTFANNSTILLSTGVKYQMELDLVNALAEPLTLTGIVFDWTVPSRITWGSVKFPSAAGATVTGPGTTGGVYTVDLDPKPAQLSTSDITVNANGTRSVLLNMAKATGNPPDTTPSIINSICVQYTIASQPGITFSCRIKPDAAANNPTTCN